MNDTCWNGLYRVNSRGEFNVPYGLPRTNYIIDEDNLRACSTALGRQHVELRCCDFEEAVKNAGEDDLVFHWTGGARGRDAEREAERFGSAFLMPEGSVRAEAPRSGRLSHIIRTKRYWNVSAVCLTYRMHTLGLLSDWQYRSLFVEMSSSGYRTKEPNSSPHETSQVLAKVMRGLREEGLTMRDIGEELSVFPDELNKYIFGLVLTAVT